MRTFALSLGLFILAVPGIAAAEEEDWGLPPKAPLPEEPPPCAQTRCDEAPKVEPEIREVTVPDEKRAPPEKPIRKDLWIGLLGASGATGGRGAGLALAASAGTERWALIADFRVAGEAFNKPAIVAGEIFTLGGLDAKGDSDFSYASFTGGFRHHLARGSVAPFFGAGVGIDYINRNGVDGDLGRKVASTAKGMSGLAGYGEVGLEVLRSQAIGGAFTVRADVPAFQVTEAKRDPNDPYGVLVRTGYAPILSAGFAFRF